ncbi:hypothetical protein PISL3812_00901 [Talaromyces islandicus]|uniref:Uncharacterized protein n=1 Tax=Talaromyces islandicus TaxID=28573 RepID=A0A0U1LKL4_TALIS|nr:hypothetical protein PISL3812_00901 [Talaromyces islandicus]
MIKSSGERELELHNVPRVKEIEDDKAADDEERRERLKTTASDSDLTPGQRVRKEELEKSTKAEKRRIRVEKSQTEKIS